MWPRPPYRLHHIYERLLGTELEVQIVAGQRQQAQDAEATALTELERLSAIFNRFDPHSEWRTVLSRPAVWQTVSPELAQVMRQADHWRETSANAFHPAADALGQLWEEASQRGSLDQARLAQTVEELQSPPWTFNELGEVRIETTLKLGLNALAKGYIVDRMLELAAQCPGVRAVLINAGGDLRTAGGSGLKVQLADPHSRRDNAPPLRTIELRDSALATSGQAHRGYRVGNEWHSHILDPRSGQPITAYSGVSVIAPSCLQADALATVLSVLPTAEGLAFIERQPGCAALLVDQAGRCWTSAGWPHPPERWRRVRGIQQAGSHESSSYASGKTPQKGAKNRGAALSPPSSIDHQRPSTTCFNRPQPLPHTLNSGPYTQSKVLARFQGVRP